MQACKKDFQCAFLMPAKYSLIPYETHNCLFSLHCSVHLLILPGYTLDACIKTRTGHANYHKLTLLQYSSQHKEYMHIHTASRTHWSHWRSSANTNIMEYLICHGNPHLFSSYVAMLGTPYIQYHCIVAWGVGLKLNCINKAQAQ